jgi:hypothetical protein
MWIVKLRDEGEVTITSCLLCLKEAASLKNTE